MDHAVVLAGGSGTRFWPESRSCRSKQFLDLTGGGPMIRETLDRLRPVVPPERLWIVAGRKDAPHLSPGALGIPKGNILLEPEGRNTAPAVALAAAVIAKADPDAVILATPADHAIADVRAFHAVIRKGLKLARETGRFVTLGIPPTHPSTGYGYIERGAPFPGKVKGAFQVARFAEKPDLATAKRFLRSGRFDWNSGLFLFRTDMFADSLSKHPAGGGRSDPGGAARGKEGVRAAAGGGVPPHAVDLDRLRHPGKGEGDPGPSREHGVERPGDLALPPRVPGRRGGNVTFGDVILTDCRNTLVRTDSGLVAVLGMEDTVVVRCGDAVLVCPRSRSEDVKGMVGEVRKRFPALA